MGKILFNRLLAVLFVAAMLSSFSVSVSANTAEAALTVIYSAEGQAVEGVHVSIYRVAEVDANGKILPSAPYSGYPIADLNTLDTEGMRSAAYTYAGYVAADRLKEASKGITDSEGQLCLSGLPVGIYLVIYSDIQIGEKRYSASPTLVSIPDNSGKEAPNYSITLNVKSSVHTEYTRVMKIWENDNSHIRPSEITVQLYCRLVGTDASYEKYGNPIALNKENNWQHAFENLPDGYEWQIIEADVPENYKVSIIQQGGALTVTNNCPSPPPLDSLPSTGTTWYLVTPLMCAGLLFVVLGLLLKKREANKN